MMMTTQSKSPSFMQGKARRSWGMTTSVVAMFLCLAGLSHAQWLPVPPIPNPPLVNFNYDALTFPGYDSMEHGNWDQASLPWEFPANQDEWVFEASTPTLYIADGDLAARDNLTTENIQSQGSVSRIMLNNMQSNGIEFYWANPDAGGIRYEFGLNGINAAGDHTWTWTSTMTDTTFIYGDYHRSYTMPYGTYNFDWSYAKTAPESHAHGYLDRVHVSNPQWARNVGPRIPWFRRTFSEPYLIDYTFKLQDFLGGKIFPEQDSLDLIVFEENTPSGNSLEGAQHVGFDDIRLNRTFVVLDYTQSIYKADLTPPFGSFVVSMEEGVKFYINEHQPDAQIGLYEFHREDMDPKKVANFTTNKQYLLDRVDDIEEEFVQGFPASTRCWDGVLAAVQEFNITTTETLLDESRYVVFVTDGIDESSYANLAQITNAALARQVSIYPIAYSPVVTDQALIDLLSLAITTGGDLIVTPEVIANRPPYISLIPEIYEAPTLNDAFQYIINIRRSIINARWVTLERFDSKAFSPAFMLEYDYKPFLADENSTEILHNIDVFMDDEVYYPESYAGDLLGGRLKMTVTPPVYGQTTAYIRSVYMPRHITQINLYIKAPLPGVGDYEVSIVPPEENGIPIANWVVELVDEDEFGGRWYELYTPNPSLETELPYAWIGNLLKIEFTNLANLRDLFSDEFEIMTDNTIYPVGQYFVFVDTPPPFSDLAFGDLAPITIVGPEGGPFAFANSPDTFISNMGTKDIAWEAVIGKGSAGIEIPRWAYVALPQSGTLTPVNSPNNSTVIRVNIEQTRAAEMASGTYYGELYISNDAGITPTTRTIILAVGFSAEAPVVTSSTHPDQTQFYPATTATLAWTPDPNVTDAVSGYFFRFDQSPNTDPALNGLETVETETSFGNLAGGTYYFHIRTKYELGAISNPTHFRVNVGESIEEPWISPMDDFSASGPLGGPFAPTQKNYTLSNTGLSDIEWQVSFDPHSPWLIADKPTGLLPAGATTSVAVMISSEADALSAGRREVAIIFRDVNGNVSDNERLATLTVLAPPSYPFPNIDNYYDITYKTKDSGYRDRSTTAVIIRNGGLADTLKIKKKKGIPEEAFAAAPIPRIINATGSFKKVYTEAIVGQLLTGGQVKNVVTKDAHIEAIRVGEIGKVKMTAIPKSHVKPGVPEAAAFTVIKSTSPQSFNTNNRFLTPKLALNGVILEGLSVENQTQPVTIKAASKKFKAKKTELYVSVGGMNGNATWNLPHVTDPFAESIPIPGIMPQGVYSADTISKIKIKSGGIDADWIDAKDIAKIQTSAGIFKLKDNLGRPIYVTVYGDVIMDRIESGERSRKLTIAAKGGDILVGDATGGSVADGGIVVGGAVSLSAKFFRAKQYLAEEVHGGVIGFAPENYVPAGDNDFSPLMLVETGPIDGRSQVTRNFDISATADVAIFGKFVAADDDEGPGYEPLGSVTKLQTRRSGTAWAQPQAGQEWWFVIGGEAVSARPFKLKGGSTAEMIDVVRAQP